MKKFIFTICVILTSSSVFTQTNIIEKIDRYAAEIDTNISLDADIHTTYMVHEIKFETNKRAIGKQYTSVKFYYPMPGDSFVETENEEEFLYFYKPPVLAWIHYGIAGTQDVEIKYYFDKSGALLYYKWLSYGVFGTESEKYYFENNGLLKFDLHTFEKSVTKEKDFTLRELNLAENISKNAKEYKIMFGQLVVLEQIDKD